MAFPEHRNVVVADHDPIALALARERHGFATYRLDATERLPFSDGEFDFVFCSSVIEHVTGPEEWVWTATSEEFDRIGRERQRAFASEIRRIAKRYYVQTPNRDFWIESHSLLPGLIVYLPRRALVTVLRLARAFWITDPVPDWRLLRPAELAAFFPDATVFRERSLGLTKSLMVVR
jgi:hypothetical protein